MKFAFERIHEYMYYKLYPSKRLHTEKNKTKTVIKLLKLKSYILYNVPVCDNLGQTMLELCHIFLLTEADQGRL